MTNSILDIIKNAFEQNAPRVLYSAITILLILCASFLALRIVKRWLNAVLNHSRIRDDKLLKDFFLRSVTFTILVFTLLTVLGEIGIDVRTFIAGLGVTGLIIGFALRDTLSNFAAGLLLLTYRPFRAGEIIEVEGSQGTVEEMTIVNMQMTTTDGVRVILPNSKVWGTRIINYSLSQRRRIEITLSVRENDIESAINSILKSLGNDDRALKEPPPSIHLTSIKNDTAALTIWVWTSPQHFSDYSAKIFREIVRVLREDEIPIA